MTPQSGGEQPVADVLEDHAAHAGDLGPVEGHLRRLLGVHVGIDVHEQELPEVQDAPEALRDH